MDRQVTVRFYSVERAEAGSPFAEALQRVNDLALADRENEIANEVIVRLERLNPRRGGLISGEMVRLQSGNLPARASRGRPVERLGVDSIGHQTAFVYSPSLSVLGIQMARNGMTAGRLAAYLSRVLEIPEYHVLPVPTTEMWEAIRNGRVRAIRVRVSAPRDLSAVEPDQVSMRDGFSRMQSAAHTTYVDVSLGMGRGEDDMEKRRTLRFLNWFRGEREADRGGITKIKASVIGEDDGSAEWLDMLKKQLGGSRRLDLPDDDPDASYTMRDNFLRQVFGDNRAALEEMFEEA